MPRSLRSAALLFTLAEVTVAGAAGLALGGCRRAQISPRNRSAPVASGDALPLRRGPFERHLALTGEIDTMAAVELKVPRVPNGKVPIRYLAPEGAEVK